MSSRAWALLAIGLLAPGLASLASQVNFAAGFGLLGAPSARTARLPRCAYPGYEGSDDPAGEKVKIELRNADGSAIQQEYGTLADAHASQSGDYLAFLDDKVRAAPKNVLVDLGREDGWGVWIRKQTVLFRTFIAAVKKAGLEEFMNGPEGVLTVFAPSDKAFERYFEKSGISKEEFLESPDLESFVKRHLVAGVVERADMRVPFETLAGDMLSAKSSLSGAKINGAAVTKYHADVLDPSTGHKKVTLHVMADVIPATA
eukprot:CAMPEP_0197665544 /NCGR_PEP_ID=MMETSP1338-20131121/59503_1 /TAXON_ID=43686 ORGANISM="Pelagodinium beii, Strain RCC1491" /NCGR_SAMPLE_ID=MMETSP1338 /ASSEMBLY_ACC=CAM_ASM_000754 /LENGTH=258 /DNA_ID=CAMNT_0043244371 /DNA_START=1 /DNA_END=777 /DNA_ORIENTATION=+